jgi:hypothetical protein
MKKLLFISVLITLAIQSCKHAGHLEDIYVTYARDNSDTNRITPDANSVLRLFGYNTQTLCFGAHYRQTYINDLSLNKEIEISIPNEDVGERENLLDNPNFRKTEVLAFREQAFKAIQESALYQFSEKPQSKVYETICRELTYLAEKKAFKKFLIISGDLIENSEICNAYASSFLRLIKEDRAKLKEVIKEKFADANELPKSLKGIAVYILFEPTKETDIQFGFFSEVYIEMLQQKGARVYIKSLNEIEEYTHE